MSHNLPFFLFFGVKNLDTMIDLAHRLIDLVEDKICVDNPKVDLLRGKHEGNTLLYGEGYYELEDEVIRILSKENLTVLKTDLIDALSDLFEEKSDSLLEDFCEFLNIDVADWLNENARSFQRKLQNLL